MAGPYIFDTSKGETPESIARKRAIAEALVERGIGMPQNVGQGLSAVGAALGAILQSRRARGAEEAGQAGVDPNGLVQRWLSGGDLDEITGGGRPSPVPGVQASPAPGVPSPSIARPPSAGAVENVPAGWGAGGSFAPPAGAPGAASPTAGVASPAGFSGSKQAFVQMMMPAALELSKKTGLDPRLIVAQAAQETGFGRHAPGGNYFGIKSHGVPGGQTLRTTEYAGGQPHAENASFRTYSGPEASVRGYGDFLQSNPRYAPMLAAQGLDAQLAALGKSGYATDPNYAASVGNIARGIPQGGPTQVASLDPSVGLPPPQTAVQKVAAAMPGAPPAGPEMASAAGMPPVSGPGMMPPPFVPPSVPTGVMPTRGVQSVAGALAAPPSPVAPPQPPQGAPPAGGTRAPSPAVVRQALENLNNPFANAGVKAQAMEVLKRADPTYQMGLEKSRIELENLRNPKPTYGFQTVNGNLVRTDPRGGTAETVIQGDPDWRDATPDEIAASHLPPDTPLQINRRTGQKSVVTGASGLAADTQKGDDARTIADAIEKGTQPPDLSRLYGVSVPVRVELEKRGYNLTTAQQDWEVTQRQLRTLTNPQQTRIRQNIDFASSSLDKIEELTKEWKAGQFPALNAVILKTAKEGGLGDKGASIATQLEAQISDLVADLAGIYMGGNSPTDHALNLAQTQLQSNWSEPVLLDMIKLARTNLKYRQNSIMNGMLLPDSPYNRVAPTPASPEPTAPPPSPPSPGPFFGAPASAVPTSPAAASPSPSSGGGPIRIRNDEDYAKLPSGTKFIGPDDRERVKP